MRVVKRTCTKLSGNTITEESYNYDAAGNITSCTVSSGSNTFVYDRNNRLISYNGHTVSYDADGNMISAYLNGAELSFAYDSANRLISAGQNSYTYNVEDVRVRNLCGESETTYAYNTNGRLSKLLAKTTDGVITKYVYGLGLIGEETGGSFKTYHFDYRGSTAAITDINGNVTDTFEYDTYGNLVSRTGTSVVIFLYNGRDGVVTDSNGLIYMRARYYSPELKRFINADIIAGEISNAVTLNRYAYANGNPVSNIDPFGLSAERGNSNTKVYYAIYVVDYDIGPGLPVVGHSKLYFLCDNGEVILTEYTGKFPHKDTAKIFVYPSDYSSKTLIKDLKRFNDNFKSMYLNGMDFVLLKGDFTDSLSYAEKLESSSDYPDYNLITNSCLTYTKKLLDKAKIDGKAQQHYINHDNYETVPKFHIQNLKKAQLLDFAISSVKKLTENFLSDYLTRYNYR